MHNNIYLTNILFHAFLLYFLSEGRWFSWICAVTSFSCYLTGARGNDVVSHCNCFTGAKSVNLQFSNVQQGATSVLRKMKSCCVKVGGKNTQILTSVNTHVYGLQIYSTHHNIYLVCHGPRLGSERSVKQGMIYIAMYKLRTHSVLRLFWAIPRYLSY